MTATDHRTQWDVYEMVDVFLMRLTEVIPPATITKALEDVQAITEEVGPRLAEACRALHMSDQAQSHVLEDLEAKLGFSADIDDALLDIMLELSGARKLHDALAKLSSLCDPDARE